MQDSDESHVIHLQSVAFVIYRECIVKLSFESFELLFVLFVFLENTAKLFLLSFTLS